MEFIKDSLALIFSTFVYAAVIFVIMSIWWGIKEMDWWYLYPFATSSIIILLGLVTAKYSPRFKAALECPLGLCGL